MNSLKRNRHRFVSIFLFLLIFFSTLTLYSQYSRVPGSLDRTNFQLLPAYRDAVTTVFRYDFTVRMRDGVRIDCLKFIPEGTPPAGGWPTVIMVHGYGDNKETLAAFCRAQAEYGYYTMTFSVRGQGNSGGLSNLISEVEMRDLLELINYVRADSVNGSGPDRILIMGGSQGGVLPYRAACNGAKVKTVITSVAPPNFASSWIENGSIKMTFLWTIEYTPDTARYTPLVDRMSNWVYANNKNKWDSLAYWLPIGRDFMNEVPNCTVPLLVEGSWQDKFFNATGIMEGLSKLNVPFSSYLGAVQGHGGDHSPSEDQWHMTWFNDWFFQWLFGINTGILDSAKYQYASTSFPVVNNYWTFTHNSSRVPLQNLTQGLKLYLNTNNKLKSTPHSISSDLTTRVLNNSVSGGLTMTEAVNEEFYGPVFDSKFKKAALTFESDNLTKDMQWTGAPKIGVRYKSSSNSFVQFNYQIYEVQPDGSSRFITRANFTDRSYVKNSKVNKTFYGQGHSHIFKAGNKIRVLITNLDTAPTDSVFLGTNPFVLPITVNSNHSIILNSNSYIEFPVIISAFSSVGDILHEEQNSQPFAYELKQNYPNPFNPATTIEYSIAKAGNVEIKVYDMLGREVKSLVNEYRDAGFHKIFFNASELSSGVYFYKISTTEFSEVKRMVLIK